MTVQNYFIKLDNVSYLSHLLTRSPKVFKGLWIRTNGVLKLIPFKEVSETRIYYYSAGAHKLFILNKIGKQFFRVQYKSREPIPEKYIEILNKPLI